MNEMITICKTTYRRILRTRSLYILLGAVLALVGITHLYADLTIDRQKELMYDASAALLTLVGLFTALIVTFDVARDLREKIVMTLLSKPLGRSQYLLGKFLGVVWIVTINLAILTIGMMLLLYWEYGYVRWDFLELACATWGSMVMMTALGMMLSSILKELPAALCSLSIFVIGHMTESLYRSKSGFSHFIFGLLPNFGLMNFKTELGNGLTISWALIIFSVLYSLIYSGALLSLATILFHRRDLA